MNEFPLDFYARDAEKLVLVVGRVLLQSLDHFRSMEISVWFAEDGGPFSFIHETFSLSSFPRRLFLLSQESRRIFLSNVNDKVSLSLHLDNRAILRLKTMT